MAAPPPKPAASPHPGHDALGARVPRGTGWGEVRGKAGQSGGERARKKKEKEKKTLATETELRQLTGDVRVPGGEPALPAVGGRGGFALSSLWEGWGGAYLGSHGGEGGQSEEERGESVFFFQNDNRERKRAITLIPRPSCPLSARTRDPAARLHRPLASATKAPPPPRSLPPSRPPPPLSPPRLIQKKCRLPVCAPPPPAVRPTLRRRPAAASRPARPRPRR